MNGCCFVAYAMQTVVHGRKGWGEGCVCGFVGLISAVVVDDVDGRRGGESRVELIAAGDL